MMSTTAALITACRGCNLSAIRACIDKGVDVNGRDEEGNTPLHIAAQVGSEECVEYLLVSRADVAAILPEVFHTPLHKAAFNGHTRVAQLLVKNGASLTAKTRNGYTPLHSTTWKGHLHTAAALLELGADPNITCKVNGAVIHGAAKQGYEEIVDLLLAHNADPFVRDQRGNTPLTVAATPRIRAAIRAAMERDEPSAVEKRTAACGGGGASSMTLEVALAGKKEAERLLAESENKCSQLWTLLQAEVAARRQFEQELARVKSKLKKLEKATSAPAAPVTPPVMAEAAVMESEMAKEVHFVQASWQQQ